MDKDVFDILLDEDCTDDIILYDDFDNQLTFKQVAIIYYENKVYALLKPVGIKDVNEDDAWAFLIDEYNQIIEYVTDEALADKIFETYYSLLDENENYE